MKLNLNNAVLPVTSLLASLASEDADGGKVYKAKVLSVDSAKSKVLLEVSEDLSARYAFSGDNAVKAGSTIRFSAEGEVLSVELPVEKAPAQRSSGRSPDYSDKGRVTEKFDR